MATSLRLKVVTPRGSLLDKEVASVTTRTGTGEICVLPEHRPILASLVPGRLLVGTSDGEVVDYAVDEGFIEGGPSHVSIITQRCVPAVSIDISEVSSQLEGLRAQISGLAPDADEIPGLVMDAEWAEIRLEVAKSYRH